MSVFEGYADYYDLLYKDKDYESEVNFVHKLIQKYSPNAKSILNLGCGTGNHDGYLEELGYEITGVDLSQKMLDLALNKAESGSKRIYKHGDVRNVNLEKEFDVVISLFHVASYQNSNQDFSNYIKNISNHLVKNGIAIFDYWYAPAVLHLRPERREKIIENDNLLVRRVASANLDENNRITTVHYDIFIKDKKSGKEFFMQEDHKMRAFESKEINETIIEFGLDPIDEKEWMKQREPSKDSWGVFSVCKKAY